MVHAGSGLSLHPDPRTAGEEAGLAAMLACEDAHCVLVFASHHHAGSFKAVLVGVESIAAPAYVSGCTGYGVATEAGVVVGVPAVAALAIGGEELRVREGQRPRGPADARLLALELGAPRGMLAYFLWPGPEAGDAAAILAGMHPTFPGFAGGPAGRWGEPATAIGSPEVTQGGTLAWLLYGEATITPGVAPDFALAADRPPAFGIYMGAADADAPFPSPRPAFPVAGLVGGFALAPGGCLAPGVLAAVSPA